MRLAALVLILVWLTPAEAGLFRRRPPTTKEQIKRQQKNSKASYGRESYRREVEKGRRKKAKLPPLATRPKVTPY